MKNIYLCDFAHNYIGSYTYMMPLNIGFLSSYARKYYGNSVEIELFKFPNDFIQAISHKKPDIVGFSSYVWNANINNALMHYVKKIDQNIIVVAGGPHIKYDKEGLKTYFNNSKCDYFVPYQGETPFNLIVEMALGHNEGYKKPIDGTYFNAGAGEIIKGTVLDRIKDVNTIPSPYLDGTLDKFFGKNLIPIIETNRGCPYRCTFCAQGLTSFNSVNYFSMERVEEELKYLSKKVENTKLLHLADANFGIIDRDIEIAEKIAKLRDTSGYPEKVSSNMAKNRPPNKMIKIAELLGNTAMIISLQSLDDKVLNNVKRKNISSNYFTKIIEQVNSSNGVSGTEIILGLPGETYQSHINTIKKLFDMNVSYIIAYNALILEGTELDMERTNKYNFKTKFRLIDSSFGEYDVPLKYAHNVHGTYDENIIAFEYEEGIRETETLTEKEILSLRPVHWLIQFMWNYRFYFSLLKSIQNEGVNPLDFILFMIENIKKYKDKSLSDVFRNFNKEAKNEWFNSPKDLIDYYSTKKRLKELKEGSFGKMNGKYIFIVSTEYKNEFESFLKNCIISYNKKWKNLNIILESLEFDSAKIIDMKKFHFGKPLVQQKIFKFKYLKQEIKSFGDQAELSIDEKKLNIIQSLMKQYEHKNLNVTLRKMSEYMPIKDLFYDTKNVSETNSLIEQQEDRAGYAQ